MITKRTWCDFFSPESMKRSITLYDLTGAKKVFRAVVHFNRNAPIAYGMPAPSISLRDFQVFSFPIAKKRQCHLYICVAPWIWFLVCYVRICTSATQEG